MTGANMARGRVGRGRRRPGWTVLAVVAMASTVLVAATRTPASAGPVRGASVGVALQAVFEPGPWSGLAVAQETVIYPETSVEVSTTGYALVPVDDPDQWGPSQPAVFNTNGVRTTACTPTGSSVEEVGGGGRAIFLLSDFEGGYSFALGYQDPVSGTRTECDGDTNPIDGWGPPVASAPEVSMVGSIADVPVPADPTALRGSVSGELFYDPHTVTKTVRWRFTTRADSDGDGRPDGEDCQPDVVNDPGEGCQTASDEDGDGVGDDVDACPGTPPGTEVDAFGCETVPAVVVEYAPQVRLHPDESAFPLGVDEFVAGSRLRWAVPGGTSGDDNDVTVAEVGEVDAGRLGDGGYVQEGWASDVLTRPGQEEGRPAGLGTDRGFYLDLDDDRREGDAPVGGEVPSAMTYSYVPGDHVTYWFMYGWNPGARFTGQFVDRHEGEWERVTVQLDADGEATAVDYWAHECAEPLRLSWAQMTDSDTAWGQVVEGTHPVVYSAKGAHASYPDARRVPKEGVCDMPEAYEAANRAGIGQGWGDVTAEGGDRWNGWEVELRDAAASPWFGFGGAWGEVGGVFDNVDATRANVTGPLAPPHKPDPGADGTVILGRPPQARGLRVDLGAVSETNRAAMRRLVWAPGLDEGFVPQGVAVTSGGSGSQLLVSGYYDGSGRTGCAVYSVDPESGQVARPVFRLPASTHCSHAGGIAHAGGDRVFVSDTNRLFQVSLRRALSSDPRVRDDAVVRSWPLLGFKGSFVSFTPQGPRCRSSRGCLWVGTYAESGSSTLRRVTVNSLVDPPRPDNLTLVAPVASHRLPVRAQGAAFLSDGELLVSSSRASRLGCMSRVRPDSTVRTTTAFIPGSEGVAVDGFGLAWTVSESGSAPYDGIARSGQVYPDYTLLVQFDPNALPTGTTCTP